MVFSGRIDNPNHPLGAGMEVHVLNLILVVLQRHIRLLMREQRPDEDRN